MRLVRQHSVLITLLFILMSTGCASMHTLLKGMGFKDPSIVCRQVEVSHVSLSGVTLEFLFDVTNPNSAGFTIAELDYVLMVNDVEAARGREERRIRIEANGSSEVRLPYTVEYKNLVSTALSFVQPQGLSYQLDIRFGLRTPVGVLPISVQKKDSISF